MALSMATWYAWRTLGILNHVIMFGVFLYALIWSEVSKYNLQREVIMRNLTGEDRTYMAEWKYLTRWDHLVQLIFFTFCLLQDVQDLMYRSKCVAGESSLLNKPGERATTLARMTDFTFHCFALPLAINVSFLYWNLKWFSPKMLSGLSYDKRIPRTPPLLDHAVHTLVTVACFLEFFLVYRLRPSMKETILCPLAFLFTYLFFSQFLVIQKGFAVYNLLKNPWYVVILCIVIWPAMWLLAWLLNTLHRVFWTDSRIRSFQFSPKQLSFDDPKIEA